MNLKCAIFCFFIFVQSIITSYSQKELEVINLDSIGADFLYFKGGEIQVSSFNHPIIGNTLHPDSLLKQFYPGAFYRYNIYETDTLSVVLWYCNDATPELLMINEYNEDTLVFIDSLLYDTRLLMYQEFVHSDKKHYAWVAFNTTEAQADFMLTGRFCSGILSLALIRQDEKGWSVVDFDKAIGFYGMFCMSPIPEVVEYRKGVHGLKLVDFNGGAGGPYFGSLTLFDQVDGKITELLTVPLSHLSETLKCNWETKIMLADSLIKNEIMLITEGEIDRDEFMEVCGELDLLPKEMVDAFAKKKAFSFSIQRIYKLVNNTYKLSSTHFKTL